MTTWEIISYGRSELQNTENGNQSAALLFEHVFGKKHFEFLSDQAQPESLFHSYRELVLRRSRGEPLQYLLGTWHFMDHDFAVGPGVLIPRGDTECAVLEALDSISEVKEPVVFDLCSGSGCIGISIACRRPDASVFCIEKSPEAFCYLKKNSTIPDRLEIFQADIFDFDYSPYSGKIDLIVCNPPYVTEQEYKDLQQELYFEPKEALVADENGLYFYRRIASQLLRNLRAGGKVVFEIGSTQSLPVERILKDAGLTEIRTVRDLNGLDRVVIGENGDLH